MRLLILAKGSRSVAAPLDDANGACPVLDFLHTQPPNRQASAKGFAALFRRYAQLGRAGLTEDQFHLANREEKIWEFRKGALRLFCFEDGDGGLVILTHGAPKESQKVKASEIRTAVEARRRYLSAKAGGQLTLEDIDDDPAQSH